MRCEQGTVSAKHSRPSSAGFACPTIAVPGFTHPVEHMFLEDVLMACPQFDAGPHIMAAKLAESSAQRFNSRNQRSLRPDKLVLQAPVNGPETTVCSSRVCVRSAR